MIPLAVLLLLLAPSLIPQASASGLEALGREASDPGAAAGARERLARLDRRVEDDRRRRRKPPRPRLPRGYQPLPLIEQETDYSCGSAALCSTLRYWDVFSGSETALHRALDAHPDHGTHPDKIVEVARAHGLRARLREGVEPSELRRALARGETVILDIQAWRGEDEKDRPWKDLWENGHYVVLVGMDRRFAYFMDPLLEARYGYIPLPELMERWHDYEDRHGPRREYVRAAIFLQGRNRPPARGARPRLERIE